MAVASEVQLAQLRQRTTRTAAVATLAACAIGVWAFWPVRSKAEAAPVLRAPKPVTSTGPARPAFDARAFGAPIWNPTPPPKPPAPLPPLRLQLVAIATEKDAGGKPRFRAMVYDPDTDTLHQVGAGEMVAGRKVVRVTATELEITDGQGTRRMTLDVPAAGGGTP